jgi:hypothetical protein
LCSLGFFREKWEPGGFAAALPLFPLEPVLRQGIPVFLVAIQVVLDLADYLG